MSRLVVLCLLRQLAAQALEQVGADIDGELESQFGLSVALSADGKHLAVGASKAGPSFDGHLRIFAFNRGTWNQVGADIAAKTTGEQFGWSVAMNAAGSRVVGGGPTYSGSPTYTSSAGVARIYQYGSGQWSQVGSDLMLEGNAGAGQFGRSVAMSADGHVVAVAGSQYNSRTGRVLIFVERGGQWARLGSSLDGTAGSSFGESVALSADGLKVAIGASRSSAFFGSVQVYAYDFVKGGWVQMGGDIVGQKVWDKQGSSVSLSASGLRVACGATGFDTDGDNQAGGVMVYEFENNAWAQLGTTIMGEGANDYFGASVSLSDDGLRVACGAPGNAGKGANAGHGRVYQYINGAWAQIGQDVDGEAEGDAAGLSVALSGDGSYFAIGAPSNDYNGNSAGHARVFTLGASVTTTKLPILVDAAVSSMRVDALYLLVACMTVSVVSDSEAALSF